MNKNWQIKAIKEALKDAVNSASTYIIILFVFLLWHFALGQKFEWQQVAPFEQPSIFIRSFYSAFTFFTLGYLLYITKFYKILHDIVVKAFGAWEIYNLIKVLVWLGLMFVSYQYIVPALFTVMNTSVSVLYNIAALVLYALPPVGISLIVGVAYILARAKIEHRRVGGPK